MSEIENAGNKGYCLMWFFIFLLLFVILVVGIYQYNGRFIG
ncbi:autophagy-related protein 27 [Flavilitoribacter nigricans]|nr:autophagy-related protein 27 [Flavilitoribacter nigricans]